MNRRLTGPGEASDRNRKYIGSGGKGDPFTVGEIKQFVIEPLELCADEKEFKELANWCATEDSVLLLALYKACCANRFDDWARYLEGAYGCGNS